MKPTAFAFTNSQLDEINSKLREYKRGADLEMYAKGGRLILERFFGGSVNLWESPSPRKQHSIRRLAQRPGAPHGKDALTRRVGVYIALQRHDFVYECEGISATHVVEVLRLPAETQARMLREAAALGLSALELRRRVVADRRENGERRGAPTKDRAKKVATRLARIVQLLTEAEQLVNQAASFDGHTRGTIDDSLVNASRLITKIRVSVGNRSGPNLARTAARIPLLTPDISG
jgi:hypothetical protein